MRAQGHQQLWRPRKEGRTSKLVPKRDIAEALLRSRSALGICALTRDTTTLSEGRVIDSVCEDDVMKYRYLNMMIYFL